MSASEFHVTVQRLGSQIPDSWIALCFLVVMGGLTRGIPTSYAAPPLAELISFAYENITVWPDASGEKLGYGVDLLHPSAQKAVRRNS